ncbi:MAG: heme exporter protein CcmB [Acidobacteriota bacterium]
MLQTYLSQVWTIFSKDLRAELRTKEALNASLAFSVVILLLLSFAFEASEQSTSISGGLLWLAYSFAGALALNRSFARELQNDCLDALIASPAPSSALFLGKALANYALLLVVELIALGVFIIFYDAHLSGNFLPLFGVMLLATWAMVVIGTLFSALTVNLHMRELMLPVLVYPLLIPALMAAMLLTSTLLSGEAITGDNWIWVRVLVAFDIVFTALGVVFIDTVLVG